MDPRLSYSENNTSPGEKKKFIRGLFDSIAPTYDLLNRVLSFGIDSAWRRGLVARAGAISGRPVLDICCGTGDLTRLFHKGGGLVTGLDFSLPMLTKGRARGWLTESIVAGDASRLPFKNASFDAAGIAFGIRNIPDIDNFIAEVLRVLKPGGRLLILELTRPHNAFIKFLYDFYLGKFIPFIGGLVSGKKIAYSYLSGTIATFIDPGDLEKKLLDKGFGSVAVYGKTFGVASIFVCVKS